MEPIFNTFSGILKETAAPAEAVKSLVFAAWPSAVGELVERRTNPIGFAEKRLVVAVEDKTWKLHLEDLAGTILAKLNRLCGDGSVAFVEFRIEPNALRVRPVGRSVKETDTEVSTKLRHAASKIENAELRSSFLETAATYLSRRK